MHGAGTLLLCALVTAHDAAAEPVEPALVPTFDTVPEEAVASIEVGRCEDAEFRRVVQPSPPHSAAPTGGRWCLRRASIGVYLPVRLIDDLRVGPPAENDMPPRLLLALRALSPYQELSCDFGNRAVMVDTYVARFCSHNQASAASKRVSLQIWHPSRAEGMCICLDMTTDEEEGQPRPIP